MSKKICIITARGGSKRIPRKNIKDFLGKPIIAYSIEVALKSNLFDEVMVSTDDDEIAKIAKSYGARIPFMRSTKTSSDFATTVDVLLEVIELYEKKEEYFETAFCIYPTAPFVNSKSLIKAYEKLIFSGFDTIFPVVRYSHPIQRALKEGNNGKIKMFYPEYLNFRSQDLEISYHDAGQFYAFKVDSLKRNKKLWNDNNGFIEIDELHAQDIDTVTDWNLAELKYELLQSTK